MNIENQSGELDLLAINPDYIAHPLSWLGHIPFAAWLAKALEPNVFVELGSYSGTSYFALCQAIKDAELSTQCVAIDTWEGDEHTGSYSEAIFDTFSKYNDENFKAFSTYLRMRFETALPQFEDKSVDLLHIDGLHTYDAVKNDYMTWLPKISDRGVIIFHDTDVDTEGFGVKRFWSEICGLYPSYNFSHSNGLGVLLVGNVYKDDETLINSIKAVAPLSERLAERLWLQQIVREKQSKIEELEGVTIPQMRAEYEHVESSFNQAKADQEQTESNLAQTQNELLMSNAELQNIKKSKSWRLLAKLKLLK
ncbi:class I SAM-dependent methyltransferase [Pseudomonas syringae group sp. J309-1]|uniref:class I SAM-dependent methyltransferase n=1 Tax=Pseudomonas syringae group sp. J309-1 TaxID=3079588 RepID=UPI0029131022|nr:class I SAM-dependent methyltransferase [Pseudomonas syringae group sp. J309-1]MDU8362131.1 class I SAM-dependent methyltransferase [Pseudomonas syringae group sp. J309-1]